jgi:hypothetical protein
MGALGKRAFIGESLTSEFELCGLSCWLCEGCIPLARTSQSFFGCCTIFVLFTHFFRTLWVRLLCCISHQFTVRSCMCSPRYPHPTRLAGPIDFQNYF